VSSEYAGHDVKQLFAMVDGAEQSLGPSREQIQAWARAQQMLDQHATALRGFRESLAVQWPPESSPASAAYLIELDRLVEAVSGTGDIAGINAAQIGHISDAIGQTRAALAPIHDEYVSNEKKIADYNNLVNGVSTGVAVVSGPVGGLVTLGAAKLFTAPPVDSGRQKQLQQQASQAMDELSATASHVTVNINIPPTYDPPASDHGYQSRHLAAGTDNAGGAQRPPVIDPPAHTRVQEPGGATSAGLALSGVMTPNAPADAPAPPPAADPRQLPGQPPLPGLAPIPGTPTGGDRILGAPSAGNLRGTGGRATTGGVRALPPGGVVGPDGVSQSGLGGTGRGGAASRAAVRRVNPVGGVIGEESGAGATSARGAGMAGAGPGRRGSTANEEHETRWDPDNPWSVATGVEPVIEPGQPEEFDIGPGVIGLDR
jgi:hypothetical protein